MTGIRPSGRWRMGTEEPNAWLFNGPERRTFRTLFPEKGHAAQGSRWKRGSAVVGAPAQPEVTGRCNTPPSMEWIPLDLHNPVPQPEPDPRHAAGPSSGDDCSRCPAWGLTRAGRTAPTPISPLGLSDDLTPGNRALEGYPRGVRGQSEDRRATARPGALYRLAGAYSPVLFDTHPSHELVASSNP